MERASQARLPCSICETPNPPGAPYCDGCGINLARKTALAHTAPAESLSAGRYVVQRLLGEGANKIVYLAHDTVLQRDVALCLIKGDGFGFWKTNPMGKARMVDEARLMARLGDHPHLVSVYDVGEEDGRTYLVCQLMNGGDLESLLARQRGGRLGTLGALDIAGQILDGLAYAHSYGIVHRDLKPANVWLTGQRTVKIGDFGLAMNLRPGSLCVRGAIVGTVAYMAPEQAAGLVPDERSDLYSLGAILYTMLAGRPPFIGDDTVDVIDQHLNASPLSIRRFNPRVPVSVERFVLRLLAKEPQLRPQTAHMAGTELEAIAWAVEHAGPHDSSAALTPPADLLHALHPPAADAFVGRRAERRELQEMAERAFSGDACLALVTGEPGVGKTRLAQELAAYTRMRGAEVLWGSCSESDVSVYRPWVHALGALVRSLDSDSLASFLGRHGGDLTRVLPSLRERLPQLRPPPILDAEQSRLRLFDAVAGLLAATARERPLLVVLDDLQWADAASLQLLLRVLEALEGAPVLFLGLVAEGQAISSAALLRQIAGDRRCRSLRLQGLSPPEVEHLITLVMAGEPDEGVAAAFHRHTNGNPLFVTEMLRLLATEGFADEITEERLIDLLPGRVQDLLRRRLAGLTLPTQTILQAASVLGMECETSVLASVVDLSSELFPGGLEEAVAAGLLSRGPNGCLRLAHSLLRAAVLSDIDKATRAALHLAAAGALEAAAGRGDEGGRSARIAYHLSEALHCGRGDPLRAAAYALAAGEEAALRFAWEEAANELRRGRDICALHGSVGGGLREDLTCRWGDALIALSLRKEGVAAYQEALEVAQAGLSAWPEDREVRLKISILQGKIGSSWVSERRFDLAAATFRSALDWLPGDPLDRSSVEWRQWIAVQLARAEAYYHVPSLEELTALIEMLRPLVEKHGDPQQRADLLAVSTMAEVRRSHYRPGAHALSSAKAEVASRREHGAAGPGLGGAYLRLGFVQLLMGEMMAARSYLEAAREAAEDTGDRVEEARAASYLSQVCRALGLVEAVVRQANRAIESADRSGQSGYGAAAQADLAWALLREGHLLEAREQALQALKVWGPGSTWPFQWRARFPLAAVAVRRGAFDQAAEQFEAMLEPGQQALPAPLQRRMTQALLAARLSGAEAAEVFQRALSEAALGNYV
jgi:eukaryotic-like serine/threonine-protein kinase